MTQFLVVLLPEPEDSISTGTCSVGMGVALTGVVKASIENDMWSRGNVDGVESLCGSESSKFAGFLTLRRQQYLYLSAPHTSGKIHTVTVNSET
jgi:hypothetical protein